MVSHQNNPPLLSDFELVLFDIDRTLVPKERTIFPELPSLLEQLLQKGLKIGTCSGRGYGQIARKVLPLFPQEALHIVAGGAQVISTAGKLYWQQTIPTQTVTNLREYLESTNAVVMYSTAEAIYTSGETLEKISTDPWDFIYKDTAELDDSQVALIFVSQLTPEIEQRVTTDLGLSYKKMIGNSGFEYFDITAKGITKAVAVQQISQLYGIAPEKIIGFGDSQNDTEFLQSCGLSVAMGNATPEIKQLADTVIGRVEEKGLIEYLQKIIEGDSLCPPRQY